MPLPPGGVHRRAPPLPQPAKALGCWRALEVGGVKLATYSRLSVHTARARAELVAAPAAVGEAADAGRGPRRVARRRGLEILPRPTPAGAAAAARVFDLADADRTERVSAFRPDGVVSKVGAADDELDDTPASTARLLLKFDEFYSYGGVLDLLFHPSSAASRCSI